MKEVWKDIKNYEGLYQISNFGRVKSLARYRYNGNGMQYQEEKYLSLIKYGRKRNYLKVSLSKNNKIKQAKVHKLVAEAFLDINNYKYIGEKDRKKYINNLEDLEINHKDENPLNNCIDNLEWCTAKYNMNYGNCHINSAKKHQKEVLQYDLNNIFIKKWDSIRIASKNTKIKETSISKCCKKYKWQKQAGGYIWRYANEK